MDAKKIFAVAAVLSVLFCSTAMAQLRVARLPLMLRGYMTPDAQTVDILETKLDRAMHVPLNGVLDVVHFLPEGECEDALGRIIDVQRQNAGKKRIKLKDVMKPLAQELDADIVVCPVLTAYDEQIYPSFGLHSGMIVYANAAVQINGYDKRTDKAFAKESYRHSHEEYGVRTRVAYLAAECMDEAIADANLREIIPSAKELLKTKSEQNERERPTEEKSHDD